MQPIYVWGRRKANQGEVTRTVADVNAPVVPLRGPRFTADRVGRAKRQRCVFCGAGAEEPRAGHARTARPRAIHACVVLVVPKVEEGERPRITLPTRAQGARVAVQEHVRVLNEEPTLFRLAR